MIGSVPAAPRTKVLFLSDLDGTWLSKNPEKRAALDRGVVELKDEYSRRGIDLEFGYVTARPPQRVLSEKLPTPDFAITDNGGFIHEGAPCSLGEDGSYKVAPQVEEWERLNAQTGFLAEDAVAIARQLAQKPAYQNLSLQTIGQVVNNRDADACPYLGALCFDESKIALTPSEQLDANKNGQPDLFEPTSFAPPKQLRDFAADLSAALASEGIQHELSPLYPFAGKPIVMLDVTSPLADKGDAVEFLVQRENIEPQHVIVAGDGGNDISMMLNTHGYDDGRRAIAVGGGSELYHQAEKLENAILQPADMDCSEAVLDGLKKHLAAIAADLEAQRAA